MISRYKKQYRCLFYFLFSSILELCSRILPLFARVLVELEGGDSLLILFILAMNGHLLRIDLMYVTLLSTADGGRRPYVISLGLAQESFYWQNTVGTKSCSTHTPISFPVQLMLEDKSLKHNGWLFGYT